MPSKAAGWGWIGRLGLTGALLLLMAPLHAQIKAGEVPTGAVPSLSTPAVPGGAVNSVERADEVIREVGRQRIAVGAQYASDQQACSSVFLMTRCLDAASERRREALARLRESEIEANAFKRRARVDGHDQALEEKRVKSEQAASAEQAGVTLRAPGKGASGEQPAPAQRNPHAAKPPMVVRPEREAAQHQPKPLTAPISAAAAAKNSASFDRKAAESADRQRVILEKKAEKERDRAARKAREADAAAKAAPAAR